MLTTVADHAQHAVVAIVQGTNLGVGTPIGSGFFINEDGYVVTNAHVYREAERLKSEGSPVGLYVPAFVPGTNRIGGMDAADLELVAIDDGYDVAILKASKLRRKPNFFKLSVTAVPVGSELAFTGYPLSQDFPVTVACGAATQGTHEPLIQLLSGNTKITGSFFLVDVPIHRGSSGSAVYLRENAVAVGIATGSFAAPLETGQGPVGSAGTVAFGYVRPLRRLVELLDEKKVSYTKVPPLDEFVNK